jgi:hypothetical protein
MTNEMKLLTELCKALGFTVIVHHDLQERKESEQSALSDYINYRSLAPNDRFLLRLSQGILGGTSNGSAYLRGEDGCYYSQLKNPIISYELKKT